MPSPEPTATTLIVETTAAEDCPHDFLGDTADIVYFISFIAAERYGADHPLARAAAVLKRQLAINLSPLLNFADARTEDAGEEALLERLWQDAGTLAGCAESVATAIEGAPELRDLTSDFPELPLRLRELADIASWAAACGAKIRLTYVI